MQLSLKKIKERTKNLPIHPTFILLILWFVLSKDILSFITFVVVVLSHEFGHYFVAKKLGYRLDSFFIAPYGVSLNYSEKVFDSKDEILIACAGPIINICISLLLVSFWWLVPNLYNFTYHIAIQSFMLGLFNLLPAYPLDGGRIMVGLLQNSMPREKAVRLTRKFNYCFSFILLFLFFITCFIDFNPTLCLCGCFLLMGIIDSKYECKYQPISIFKKHTKNFSKPSILAVNCDVTIAQLLKHIEINKFTIFIVILPNGKTVQLDEEKVKKLSLTFPINSKINEILK